MLGAWAVFSNHYHFVARSPAGAATLQPMLRTLHVRLAGRVNKLDGTTGRKVWYQFRDTLLTYEKSYLARLNYVHQNAVRHRLGSTASQCPWSSAGWLERTADPATIKTIYGFKPIL